MHNSGFPNFRMSLVCAVRGVTPKREEWVDPALICEKTYGTHAWRLTVILSRSTAKQGFFRGGQVLGRHKPQCCRVMAIAQWSAC